MGHNYSGSITSGFWDVESSGIGVSGDDNYGAIGKSTAEMQNVGTFTDGGWDFVGEGLNGDADVWRLCVDGSSYPRLAWEFYRHGDFVCGDGLDMHDFDYISDRYLDDGCGQIFDSSGGNVNFTVLADLGQQWLTVGCGDCQGADISGDGSVNFDDVFVLAEQWLCSVPANWDRADLDGDGIVADSDLDLWIDYWIDGY